MQQKHRIRGHLPVTSPRRLFRRFGSDRRGAALAEFALIAPVWVVVVFGVLEFALVAFVSVMMEAGVRDASRFGLTGADAPGGKTREVRIAEIVSDRTLGLVPVDHITVDVRTYETFADIGLGEPFTDIDGNGLYDPGESFTDLNANGTRDADRGTPGAGGSEDIVLYEVSVTWGYITPMISAIVGKEAVLRAALAVRNEPFDTTGVSGTGS